MTRRHLALALAAILALPAAAQEEPAPPAAGADERVPVAQTNVAPRALVAPMGRRLGGEFAKGDVPSRDAVLIERERAAAAWLREALAPLEAPACAAVLKLAGWNAAGAIELPPGLLDPQRPVADAPAAATLLLPQQLAPLSKEDVEQLRSTGLIPFEIALGGEYARAVAAHHAGPPPADPLLRAARAARLEGVARLAGILLTVRGANVDAADLGIGALSADHDEAGVPWPLGVKTATDPVRRALLRSFYEDGLRWALFHYLTGRLAGVAAALEHPGKGPESLLRPGIGRPAPAPPPGGCRLGPRGALALLTALDDAGWIDTLVADSVVAKDGRLRVWLAFEDPGSASRARDELQRAGIALALDGAVLAGTLARTGQKPPATR